MNYCLNLNELVCFSEEEYIRKAIELAHNPVKIQKLRSQILSDFKKSELCDVQGFANKFETMLFQIWKQESIKWNTTDIQSQKELFFNLCDQYYQAETNKDFRKLSKAIKQLQISFPEQDTTWFYSSLESVKEGAVEKAIFELRKALEIKADSKAYNNNLVMLSHYSSELSKEEMLSFAQNYYENFVKKFKEDSQVSFSF
jgi:tetratricopeptide (TPR) repeat protein